MATTNKMKLIAIDPKTGLRLRKATGRERREYLAQGGVMPVYWPIHFGNVMILEDTGPERKRIR